MTNGKKYVIIARVGGVMRSYLIFGIFSYIVQQKQTTSKKIAEEFEISRRTVYRYIDNLCSAGVPIVCTKGKNGGICILESFNLLKAFK